MILLFRGKAIALLFIAAIIVIAPRAAWAKVFEVGAYGVKGDGVALDTSAIQAAVDAAAAAGGGVVHVGSGSYRTTTITLKDHVILDLDEKAILQASLTAGDWAGCNLHAVVEAVSVKDIAIQGKGTIDGGGLTYYDRNKDGNVVAGKRPQCCLRFDNCQNVKVSGITCRNSVKWTQVYLQCDHVVVDGVIIRNRESCLNRETDGIDIITCRHVLVQNCDIQTGDDALCVKMHDDPFQKPARLCADVVLKNCTVATTCNATKIGTGTASDASDVHFVGITVNKLPNVHGKTNSSPDGTCLAAISVQSNDGGKIRGFTFEDYTVNDCNTPIFMEVQNRWRKGFGSVSDITVSNFTCTHSSKASQINVQKGGRLARITLENLTIHNAGTSAGAASPPYLEGKYPDAQKYGEMPAYGLFARCVDGLTLKGKINFIDDGHSGRPATRFEDVILTPASTAP